MRSLGLVLIAATALSLSGCSQISSIFGKKKPHYHTADGSAVYVDSANTATTFVDNSYTDPALRSTPSPVYQFADQSYTGASQYAGYGVELYSAQPRTAYVAPAFADPRDTQFVKLNGESELSDWQNCETLNRGYLFISEYDFRLDPGFEVCMRNKGYVFTTEAGPTTTQVLSAQTAGLRRSFQPSTPSYSYPSTSSGYPGFFQ